MMVFDDNVILLQPNRSLFWNGKSVLMSPNRVGRFSDSSKNDVATAYLLPGEIIAVESPRYHMQVTFCFFLFSTKNLINYIREAAIGRRQSYQFIIISLSVGTMCGSLLSLYC